MAEVAPIMGVPECSVTNPARIPIAPRCVIREAPASFDHHLQQPPRVGFARREAAERQATRPGI